MDLLSIKRILDKGWSITANKDRLVISNGDITMAANWIANLCQLQFSYMANTANSYTANTANTANSRNDNLYIANTKLSMDLIHQRLAHYSNDYIVKTIANTKGLEISQAIETDIACKPCLEGKSHKTIGQNPLSNSQRPIELIHTDIAGPYIKSLN